MSRQTTDEGKKRSLYGYAEKLSPDHTDGKPAILTIASIAIRNFAQGGKGEDWKMVITYEEFPSIEHPINRTSWKTLSDKLGKWEPGDKDFGNVVANHPWLGKQVVVAPTTRNNPTTGEAVEKLDIAAPARWDKLMSGKKGK